MTLSRYHINPDGILIKVDSMLAIKEVEGFFLVGSLGMIVPIETNKRYW